MFIVATLLSHHFALSISQLTDKWSITWEIHLLWYTAKLILCLIHNKYNNLILITSYLESNCHHHQSIVRIHCSHPLSYKCIHSQPDHTQLMCSCITLHSRAIGILNTQQSYITHYKASTYNIQQQVIILINNQVFAIAHVCTFVQLVSIVLVCHVQHWMLLCCAFAPISNIPPFHLHLRVVHHYCSLY